MLLHMVDRDMAGFLFQKKTGKRPRQTKATDFFPAVAVNPFVVPDAAAAEDDDEGFEIFFGTDPVYDDVENTKGKGTKVRTTTITCFPLYGDIQEREVIVFPWQQMV